MAEGGSGGGRSRWKANPLQLNVLMGLYASGNGRMPNNFEIEEISNKLELLGDVQPINLKNWFDNTRRQQLRDQRKEEKRRAYLITAGVLLDSAERREGHILFETKAAETRINFDLLPSASGVKEAERRGKGIKLNLLASGVKGERREGKGINLSSGSGGKGAERGKARHLDLNVPLVQSVMSTGGVGAASILSFPRSSNSNDQQLDMGATAGTTQQQQPCLDLTLG